MRFRKICYRLHDPQWAFEPTSGAGAAIHGGRFNPKGVEALYLALTIETAFAEISQGFTEKYKPCLLVCYDVDCEDIADLREEKDRAAFNVTLEEMASPWFFEVAQGREPLSWRLARRLMRQQIAGILGPSFAPGTDPVRHQNLVLWKWGSTSPHKVVAYDPDGRLAKDQKSWRRG